MRIRSTCAICALSLALWTCQNIEDAPTSSRKTFIRVFEGPTSITATDLEIVPDGFVILGNMTLDNETTIAVAFKTDANGNRDKTIGFQTYPGGTGKSIKHITSPFDGYIIVGDSINNDPNSDIVANIEVASARVLVLDENLQEVYSRSHADTTVSDSNPYIADFYGESVTVTPDNRILLLGTYREGVQAQLQTPLKPFVFALTSTLTRDWIRVYDLINRNYNNSRSIHFYDDKIYWASSIERLQGDLTFSYVSVPVVQDESVFVNYSLIGETTDQLFATADIQPAKDPGFGFGVVGTYSLATDGSQSNIFFLRTDASGTIDPTSIKYFDAIGSANGTPVASNVSQIVDKGESLASTYDGGFVIAGTLDSNPQSGKGLRDIILIKLNAFGDTQWVKMFGGEGDEEVVSVIETPDHGLVICGTSTIGTYSTPMLIKTDKNGELKD